MTESKEFVRHLNTLNAAQKRQLFSEMSERQDQRKFWRAVQVISALTPATDSALKEVLWGHIGTEWERVLSFHPAYEITRLKTELKHLLLMLSDCTRFAREAYGELEDLHSKNHIEELHKGQVERRIGKEFYTFVHLAASQIDLCRRYKKRKSELCPQTDVSSALDACKREHFSDEFNHLFITDMRNNLSHVILHRPSWQLSNDFSSGEKSSGYVFDCEQLLLRGSWKSKLTEQLKCRDKIDVYTEMLTYFNASKAFYDALDRFDDLHASEAETHLQTCEGMRDAIHKASMLGIWKQVVANRPEIDPYKHLSPYFSENEIRLIERLPKHSREQADFMIEIADAWGIADDQIRKNVYAIFGVD